MVEKKGELQNFIFILLSHLWMCLGGSMHMRINQGLNQNTQNVFICFFFRGGAFVKTFIYFF